MPVLVDAARVTCNQLHCSLALHSSSSLLGTSKAAIRPPQCIQSAASSSVADACRNRFLSLLPHPPTRTSDGGEQRGDGAHGVWICTRRMDATNNREVDEQYRSRRLELPHVS